MTAAAEFGAAEQISPLEIALVVDGCVCKLACDGDGPEVMGCAFWGGEDVVGIAVAFYGYCHGAGVGIVQDEMCGLDG